MNPGARRRAGLRRRARCRVRSDGAQAAVGSQWGLGSEVSQDEVSAHSVVIAPTLAAAVLHQLLYLMHDTDMALRQSAGNALLILSFEMLPR